MYMLSDLVDIRPAIIDGQNSNFHNFIIQKI